MPTLGAALSADQTEHSTGRKRRFESEFRLRVPAVFPAALDRAARQLHTTKSAYVRAAVLARLRADGIDLVVKRSLTAI